MKVEIKTLTKEAYEQRLGDILRIDINSEEAFMVMDGEPEDANLNRDFNDCYKIGEMMQRANQAGLQGETLEINHIKVSLDEI